jgi:hypothetical protein
MATSSSEKRFLQPQMNTHFENLKRKRESEILSQSATSLHRSRMDGIPAPLFTEPLYYINKKPYYPSKEERRATRKRAIRRRQRRDARNKLNVLKRTDLPDRIFQIDNRDEGLAPGKKVRSIHKPNRSRSNSSRSNSSRSNSSNRITKKQRIGRASGFE